MMSLISPRVWPQLCAIDWPFGVFIELTASKKQSITKIISSYFKNNPPDYLSQYITHTKFSKLSQLSILPCLSFCFSKQRSQVRTG